MNRRYIWIYLGETLFLAAFGAIYEYFSFGVFTPFMYGAFLIPLIPGFIRVLIFRDNMTEFIAHMGIMTLSVGSIIEGVLLIYGTTNHLIEIYLIAGLLLTVSGMFGYIRRKKYA